MPTHEESDSRGEGRPPREMLSERELIVMVQGDAQLRAAAEGVESTTGVDIASLNELLVAEEVRLEPLFGSEERLRLQAGAMPSAEQATSLRQMSRFYRVPAEDERLDELATRLADEETVDAAYVKPPTEFAMAPPKGTKTTGKRSSSKPPAKRATPDLILDSLPAVTPDFTSRQGYLRSAPGGVDADYAATIPGGSGAGINVIDIEGAWLFTHEDLFQNQGGVIGGTPPDDLGWRNHGTAVVGEIGGDRNGFGITGIAPGAQVSAISIFGGVGSAQAIRQAADQLDPGDILLIELHRPGPRFNYQSRTDQRGYIALEWFPDDFEATRYATAQGVIVVAAAGNGAEDFDDSLYDTRPAGFPATWANPFNPANPSSGAVFVGAGAPPPGTHGNSAHGPDRSRLSFSNFGARVDAQGWGREVTTTGGRRNLPGDLQGGSDETLWYTDAFSGTSSASPIVVGSLACIQGHLEATGRPLLTPATARQVLRVTGSLQQDAQGRPATQRIGNRPDIKAAIAHLTPVEVQSGIATAYWDESVAYPPGSTASLWFLVNNQWQRLDKATPSMKNMVQRAFLGTGSGVRVWYENTVVVGLVVHGS